MLKLNTTHQPLTISCPPPTDLKPGRRLIVPVQNVETDLTAVTRRIWDLAESTGAEIKFIGLYNDPVHEPSLKRTLVTLSAMLNYGKVSADIEIAFGKDWVTTLRSRLQPGDTIVCWDETPVGVFQKPLSQILQSDLNAPIYMLTGFFSEPRPRPNIVSIAITWMGFLTIVLGSLFLQIKVYQLAKDWATPLVLLSTAIEFWLIAIWNKFAG